MNVRRNGELVSHGFGTTLMVLMMPVFTEETDGMHIMDLEWS